MATVSLGGVEAGARARGGRVSGGLALVPVVAAETEAATATDQKGLGEAVGTRWKRRFERLLVHIFALSVPGGEELLDIYRSPEEASTA